MPPGTLEPLELWNKLTRKTERRSQLEKPKTKASAPTHRHTHIHGWVAPVLLRQKAQTPN
jgi:hypothetical protein